MLYPSQNKNSYIYLNNNMIVALVTVLIFTVVCESRGAETEKCMELFQPETIAEDCCDGMDCWTKDVKECGGLDATDKSSSNEWQCDTEECILKKHDLLLDDGSLNETATIKLLDSYASEHPDEVAAVARVKSRCLSGKFKAYAPKPVCDSIKFYVCGYINTIMECPKWKNTDECQRLKDLSVVCKPMMDKALEHLSETM